MPHGRRTGAGDEMTDHLTWDTAQPYYVAYCISNGAESPQAQLDSDMEEHGTLNPYLRWISRQWRKWKTENNLIGTPFISEAWREEFLKWLMISALKRTYSCSRYWFSSGQTEVSNKPALYLEPNSGGDPIIIATVARVYRNDELKLICALASRMYAIDLGT